jgi:hypothetical protein
MPLQNPHVFPLHFLPKSPLATFQWSNLTVIYRCRLLRCLSVLTKEKLLADLMKTGKEVKALTLDGQDVPLEPLKAAISAA